MGGAICLTELAGVFDHSCLYREKKAPWNLEDTHKVECVWMYACMSVCGCVVLDQQQQHHWNLLEVKCSGPPRLVLNQIWDNDGAHNHFTKKPSEFLGDLEVLI